MFLKAEVVYSKILFFGKNMVLMKNLVDQFFSGKSRRTLRKT